MFKDSIRKTPLTNEAANEFFDSRIYGEFFNGDSTLLSTLRALVYPRMAEEDTLYFSMQDVSSSKGRLESYGDRAFDYLFDLEDWRNRIFIVNTTNTELVNREAWMDYFDAKFTERFQKFRRVDKVSVFFRKVFRVSCFINPDNRISVIFTDNLNFRTFHYLQCGIPAFLPWYFDPAVGISETEMELLNSLREKTADKYLACIKKIAEQYDFQTQRIKRLLSDFEIRHEKLECDRTTASLTELISKISRTEDAISQMMREKRDLEIKLLGLEMRLGQHSGESELLDYFMCNKNMDLIDCRGDNLRFTIKTKLSGIDEYAEGVVEQFLNNPRSLIYEYCGRHTFSPEDMRMLLEEIFLKQRLTLRFCAAYNLTSVQMEGISNYDFGPEFDDYLPNPHIQRYECTGDYRRAARDCLNRGDYVMAMEICMSSAKTLSPGDTTVLREFLTQLCTHTGKFVELPDGRNVSVRDAVAWLHEEKEAQNATAEGGNE